MRKLEKECKLLKAGNKLAIIEKAPHHYNANSSWHVRVIDLASLLESNENNCHNTTTNDEYYTIVSYNIDLDVYNLISKKED